MAKTKATTNATNESKKAAAESRKAAAEARKAALAAKAERAKLAAQKIPGRNKAHGFAEFVRKQGVVGLAVGLAIGTQASELVKNIVGSVITPIVDLLVGKEGLKGLTYFVQVGDRSATFNFGLLIDSTIKFLAVAIVIYFVIMGLKLDRLDKKKD